MELPTTPEVMQDKAEKLETTIEEALTKTVEIRMTGAFCQQCEKRLLAKPKRTKIIDRQRRHASDICQDELRSRCKGRARTQTKAPGTTPKTRV